MKSGDIVAEFYREDMLTRVDDFKAQIVQEVLKEDKLITQIASAHGIHPNLIGEWKAAALQGLPSLFEKEHSELAKERATHEKQVNELLPSWRRISPACRVAARTRMSVRRSSNSDCSTT